MRVASLALATGFSLRLLGQSCITFTGPEMATLHTTTGITGLSRQTDGSYTAFSGPGFQPYSITSVTSNFQNYIGSCVPPPTTTGPATVTVSPPAIGTAWQVAAFNYFSAGPSLPGAAETGTPAPQPFVTVGVLQSGSVNLTSYPIPNGAFTVGTADFNNDGKADLAVLYSSNFASSNPSNGGVSILLGRGDGTFQPAVNYPVAVSVTNATIADFNGDGKMDIAVGSTNPGTVTILMGNGDGTFRTGRAITTLPGQPLQVLAADFNADGKMDLAVASSMSQTCTVSILAGNGDGTFAAPQTSPAGTSTFCSYLAAGDFNKDGKLDLAVTDALSSLVYVLLGDGAGTFGAPTPYSTTYFPSSLVLTDFDHDGNLDIVTGTGSPGMIVWNFGSSSIAVLLGNGDGTFRGGPVYPTSSAPLSIAAADLNGDGKPDLITANQSANNLTILMNQGNGKFSAAAPYSLNSANESPGPTALAVADFNGDGKADLAVARSSGGIAVAFGNGNGTFQAPTNYATGIDSVSLAAGDLNGDGKPDLVVANEGNIQSFGTDSGSVSILLSSGGGGFKAATNIPVGIAPDFVVLQDVNGDGKLDLVVVDYGVPQGSSTAANPGGVSVLIGNGDGTFKPAVSYPAMNHPTAAAAGDVDGDGKPDLVVTTTDANFNGMVGVYRGNGDGTFKNPVFYPGAFGMTEVVITDLNGDGKADLLLASCCGATQPAYLLGNGDGTFQQLVYFNGQSPYFLAVADYNGDGKPDVALANQGTNSSGYVTVLLNTTQKSTFVTKLATAGQVEPFAPNAIVAAYGTNLAVGTQPATTLPLQTSLDGTTVSVTDSAGVPRFAYLFYVSPAQVNYDIPDGTAPGTATVTITNKNGVVQTATIEIGTVSPGLFFLDASGLVAALVLPVVDGKQQSLQQVYQLNASGQVVPLPINVAAKNSQFYLEMYGTGIRNAKNVTVTVGNMSVPILYSGKTPDYAGEDQVNIGPLPAALAGKGSVDIILTADGQAANTVNVTIQ